MADLRVNVGIRVNNEAAKREVREVDQQVDALRANAVRARREVEQANRAAASTGGGVMTPVSAPTGGVARFNAMRRATTGMEMGALARQAEAVSRVTGHPAAGVLGAVPGGAIIGQVGGLMNPWAIGTLAITVGVMGGMRGLEQQERAQKLGFDQRYSRRAAFQTFLNSTVGPVARSFTRLGRFILEPLIGNEAARGELRADRLIRQVIDPTGFEIEQADIAKQGLAAAETAADELAARTRARLGLPIQRVGAFVALDNRIKERARVFGGLQGRTFAENLRQDQADWLLPSDVSNEYARRRFR
jgi:hypothetical protein